MLPADPEERDAGSSFLWNLFIQLIAIHYHFHETSKHCKSFKSALLILIIAEILQKYQIRS